MIFEKNMRIIFTSDLHGNLLQYKKLVERAIQEQCKMIFIGGDLFPKPSAVNRYNEYTQRRIEECKYRKCVQGQYRFFMNYILDILLEFLKHDVENKIFCTFGNTDFKGINNLLVKELESRSIRNLYIVNQRFEELESNIDVLGFCCTPFKGSGMFDWQRTDDFDASKQPDVVETIKNGYGWSSMKEETLKDFGLVIRSDRKEKFDCPCVSLPLESADKFSFENEFSRIMKLHRKERRFIFQTHCPPSGTKNALIESFDYGSAAIRRFIEKNSESIHFVLTGHIHECISDQSVVCEEFVRTGVGARINGVAIISSGNIPISKYLSYCVIEFDEKNVTESMKISRKEVLV